MKTVIFIFALFTISLGKVEPSQSIEENLNINKRVIGGDSVRDQKKYPWQAFMMDDNGRACGAVVISSHWLITTASCVYKDDISYTVSVGSLDREAIYYTKSGFTHPIVEIIKPEEFHRWNAYTKKHDIALLRVANNLTNGDTVKPIALADDKTEEKDCWITGWGCVFAKSSPSMADFLHEAEVDVYKKKECEEILEKHHKRITYPCHVCVGDKEKNLIGSCNVDDGGPLTCGNTAGHPVLVGVASWRPGKMDTSVPSVYTRISCYRPWIHKKSGV